MEKTAGYGKGGLYLTLVNRENKIPDDWKTRVELLPASNCDGEEFLVEKETLKALDGLKAEFLAQGVKIEIDSCFRTMEKQQRAWDYHLNREGLEYTKTHVAVPGFSEHHTGLAVDIFIKSDGKRLYRNEKTNPTNGTFSKIHSRLAAYGFILRYPEGKEEITKYSYEPWHIRYVGKAAAKEIYEKGLTLEEYLETI